ncbi:MAG: hypothetical protein M3N51_09355 [Actinomycetota bacterium]|nr:hypothetical protein [Actinomycetota bacterium]
MHDDQRGVTSVEWLGMAAIAVLVMAVLFPQIRDTATQLWAGITSQLTGFFG